MVKLRPVQNRKSRLFLFHNWRLGLTGLITKAKIKLVPIKSHYINVKNVRYHSIDEFFKINEEMESNNEYTVSFVDLGLSKKNNNIRGVYHAGNHKII